MTFFSVVITSKMEQKRHSTESFEALGTFQLLKGFLEFMGGWNCRAAVSMVIYVREITVGNSLSWATRGYRLN